MLPCAYVMLSAQYLHGALSSPQAAAWTQLQEGDPVGSCSYAPDAG